MKNLITKSDLANWLVNQNNDCGNDTYFTEDSRSSFTTEDSYKKFMKITKDELISIIFDYSTEGQKYLEDNNLVDS